VGRRHGADEFGDGCRKPMRSVDAQAALGVTTTEVLAAITPWLGGRDQVRPWTLRA
jgi:hypothetical protein